MNEHAARAYLELCRETVLDQNRISKQYSAVASGIITFGLVLLGIGFSLALQTGDGPTVLSLLGLLLLGGAYFLVVWIAWHGILVPLFMAEYNLEHAEGYARYTASGQKVGQTLIDFAEYYRAMIDFNRDELQVQVQSVKYITYLALFELGVVIVCPSLGVWASSL